MRERCARDRGWRRRQWGCSRTVELRGMSGCGGPVMVSGLAVEMEMTASPAVGEERRWETVSCDSGAVRPLFKQKSPIFSKTFLFLKLWFSLSLLKSWLSIFKKFWLSSKNVYFSFQFYLRFTKKNNKKNIYKNNKKPETLCSKKKKS